MLSMRRNDDIGNSQENTMKADMIFAMMATDHHVRLGALSSRLAYLLAFL